MSTNTSTQLTPMARVLAAATLVPNPMAFQLNWSVIAAHEEVLTTATSITPLAVVEALQAWLALGTIHGAPWSRADMTRQCGISEATLGLILSGKHEPTIPQSIAICRMMLTTANEGNTSPQQGTPSVEQGSPSAQRGTPSQRGGSASAKASSAPRKATPRRSVPMALAAEGVALAAEVMA